MTTISNRRTRIAAVGVGVAGAMLLCMSMSVYARVAQSYENRSTSYCLDSDARGYVYTLPCNGGNFQNWNRSGLNLVNVATGKCLDSNDDGGVYALKCNGGDYQSWLRRNGRFVNLATDRCLDSNAKREVYARGCNGGNYQAWE